MNNIISKKKYMEKERFKILKTNFLSTYNTEIQNTLFKTLCERITY